MILPEKIVTVIQLGTANTRWRDFVDINALLSAGSFDTTELRSAIERVTQHRQATIRPLAETLNGYAAFAQQRWVAWRRNQRLEATTPSGFNEILEPIVRYTDELLA